MGWWAGLVLVAAAWTGQEQVLLELRDVPDLGGVHLPVAFDLAKLAPGWPSSAAPQVARRGDEHGAVPVQRRPDDERLVILHRCDGEVGRYALTNGGAVSAAAGREWSFSEEPPGRRLVSWEGRPVFGYCHGRQLAEGLDARWARSSYVYPLYGPGGHRVLEDFPEDHHHHRGISWMWPQVLVGDEARSYDLWTLEGIRNHFHSYDQLVVGRVFARIGVRNRWVVGEETVVHESVRITAYPPEPASPESAIAGATVLDFDLGWRAADEPVSLAGQTAGGKGYGGFLVRLADAAEVQLHTPRGTEAAELVHQRFPWTALSGRLEGTDQVVTLAILAHPDNPGDPSEWLMRFQGYVGHSWPGLEPAPLPQDGELRMRFRVLVLPGRPRSEELAFHYRVWARPPRLVVKS